MYIKTRITLFRDETQTGHGFGRGVAQLLAGVQSSGSLYSAARELGMAYSKAWSILRQVEEEFSVQLLVRDGAHGSRLSADGEQWLARYKALQQAAAAAAQAELERIE